MPRVPYRSRTRAAAVRLTIVDDSPFVRAASGAIHPIDATFPRFAAALGSSGAFAAVRYLIPVRPLSAGSPPLTMPAVDEESLTVVPTAPFDGIAGYLPRLPVMLMRNGPRIHRAVACSDLVLIKAPASNALLTAALCRLTGKPRFAYVVGSVRGVVGAQDRVGLASLAARGTAIVYDGITSFLQATGPAVVLDADLFTSVITADDIRGTAATARPRAAGAGLRLAWAGRMAAEKGLIDLLHAVRALLAEGLRLEVDLIGDGRERPRLERQVQELGLAAAVRWAGHLADRRHYFERLREADIFVLPSRSEGVPKVVVEAMVAGLPVIATATGGVPGLLAAGRRGRLVPVGSPTELAAAIRDLAADESERARLRSEGLRWSAAHTVDAQAGRLIAWMKSAFPELAWADHGPLAETATTAAAA